MSMCSTLLAVRNARLEVERTRLLRLLLLRRGDCCSDIIDESDVDADSCVSSRSDGGTFETDALRSDAFAWLS